MVYDVVFDVKTPWDKKHPDMVENKEAKIDNPQPI